MHACSTMKPFSANIRLFTILFTLLLSGMSLSAAELPETHPLDKSETRTLVLENGLRVAMVSDPDLNLASAAMAVGVGSYANPDDAQGLAHFLEHMLFLGTEKYPSEKEYGEYLEQNGGRSNAYTSSDLTNYHFEVYPVAFEGALDRFAQFFIAPLFTEEFTEREMNAVDSEFEKNREVDDWRQQYLFGQHVRPGHPQNQFATGNLDSLKDVSRETLIDFYRKYYSADRMALSLVSPLPLDEMEDWVREYFSAISGRGDHYASTDRFDRLTYPSDVLEPLDAYRLLQIQATEDRREFSLIFSLPSLEDDWDAKTARMISHIVGYEGEGSLLSDLKSFGLASALAGSIWEPTPDYAWLYVSVELTPAGLADTDRVAQLVLGYFKKLREEPYPDYIYKEMATMARLDELYTDKGEGAGRALALANRILSVPLANAIRAPYLYLREDPDEYATILDQIVPENMLAILMAKGLQTDTVEPIYGTEYKYEEITGERFEQLTEAPILPEFTLPAPNPFVPDQVELLSERPIKLIDRPGLLLLYGQDTTFQRPKVTMTFRFRPVWDATTVEDEALLDLLQACFYEAINETGYAASSAGANYAFSTTFEELSLSFSGYSESVETLCNQFVPELRSFELSPIQFAAVKDRLLRGWKNEIFGNAFRFIRYYQRQIAEEASYLPWEKAAVAENFTLEDVYAFRDRVFSRGRIEALVYGNATSEEAIDRAESVSDALGFEIASPEETYDTRLIDIAPGEHLFFEDVLPSNNSCYREDFVVGPDTPHNRMALAVASKLIGTPYYAELRTRQQLGYVVWSGEFSRKDRLMIMFLIQSGDYDPIELKTRSDTFIAGLPDLLAQMPPEAFAQAQAAVRSQLEEKPTSIAEKAQRFASLAFEYDQDWERLQNALDALETLTIDDVITLLESMLDPDQGASSTVYLYARQHEESGAEVDGVEDIVGWKTSRTYGAEN